MITFLNTTPEKKHHYICRKQRDDTEVGGNMKTQNAHATSR